MGSSESGHTALWHLGILREPLQAGLGDAGGWGVGNGHLCFFLDERSAARDSAPLQGPLASSMKN